MLIRIRSNVGVWRVDGLDEGTATLQDVLVGITQTRPHVVYEKPLSKDPACTQELTHEMSLKDQGLGHGSMIHCRVDASTCVDVIQGGATAARAGEEPSSATAKDATDVITNTQNMKRIIGQDGTIKLVHSDQTSVKQDDRGFRKGMLPLRDMKMAWTLNEFVAMDSQYEFKIKRQEEAFCKGVSLDTASVGDFQTYLRQFNFTRQRFGFLYGRYVPAEDDDKDQKQQQDSIHDAKKKQPVPQKVIVEAIYEPPQEADPTAAEGFIIHEDPMEDTVDSLAQMLGLIKVGWIYGHPPREDGFVMSAAEVIMAAEFQLEAAGGLDGDDTPFVTVKVTVGDDGNTSVEAFQVSRQCMEMAAEEALEVGDKPGFCNVNETFTAIQEGKESKTVENNFFLTVVPIVQHTSEMFVSQFPKANRDLDDRTQSHDEMKRQLSKSGKEGWTFLDLLSDFNLLIYLCKFLDVATDIPKICDSVVNRSKGLDEGYKLIIASMAGMDGSY
eukprot:CAMPEP_0195296338 /NCGR_PEP_ID=MMETSP0707-20130614/19221_1 /TAXON_ID=33640 /ORGANISM="Asterionellopsis glacialis, Strain CCMP134" /LENGTH=497 /DNA_ID=CAMNT_0040357813 /DNA_START=168 /DNA_END=1661 /DNA_ORIENTATION=-